MDRVRVKICGITKIEDALFCAKLGVDAIGLVFCQNSPRTISIEKAQSIIKILPPFMTIVGLFMDDSSKVVREVLQNIRLDLLQFHGEETNEFCTQFGIPFVKSIAMVGNKSVSDNLDDYPDACGFIVDSHAKGQAGGTGKTFDWECFPKGGDKPIILAGGLSPENISQAIDITTPYGVDVSSGVETDIKGVKDHNKISKFIRGVNSVCN